MKLIKSAMMSRFNEIEFNRNVSVAIIIFLFTFGSAYAREWVDTVGNLQFPAQFSSNNTQQSEEIDLEEIMLNAPPIPMPDPSELTLRATDSQAQDNSIIFYDPATGQEIVYPAPDQSVTHSHDVNTQSDPGRPAPAPIRTILDGSNLLNQPGNSASATDFFPTSIAQPPQPVTSVYNNLPRQSTVKLAIKFASSSGGSHFGSCSGVIYGEFWVLTAGHCIYHHDLDGNKWAQKFG